MCDNVFGESGEFDLEGTIDMLSPVRSNTYKPGEYVPITWQSYWVSGLVDLKVWKDGHVVFQELGTTDDGVYTFYISPDMGPGSYEVTVSKAGSSVDEAGIDAFWVAAEVA